MSDSHAVRHLEVRWTEPTGKARAQTADIVTLDRTSTRLELAELVPFGQKCELDFGAALAASSRTMQATVRDVRPQGGKRHRVACQFDVPLTDELLAALSDSGSFNRRAHERRPVALDIKALPELSQGQGQFAVQIVDLSPGGCCLKSPQQVPSGYRIRLSADRDSEAAVAIPLRVQWQKPADDQFLVGCSFCHASGYQQLAAQALDQSPASSGKSGPRLLNRMFFLAAGAVGLGAGTPQG
jgi:hypothetical protein